MEIVLNALLTGGVAVTLIKLLENIALKRLEQRGQGRKQQEERQKKIEADISALTTAQRVVMCDRLKYLGRKHIEAGAIYLDERENIIAMHAAYHDLGGNGNLDILIREAMALPLKYR